MLTQKKLNLHPLSKPYNTSKGFSSMSFYGLRGDTVRNRRQSMCVRNADSKF